MLGQHPAQNPPLDGVITPHEGHRAGNTMSSDDRNIRSKINTAPCRTALPLAQA
jgi:hypothetical protein